MSSRGRGGYGGYGGGSYNNRGSSYRGSYRGSSRGGGFESRGGRSGGGGGGYSSYQSESRSANRYSSSRDRIEEPYKKSYRTESSASYSNRDYGGRSGSPERKRMRMEGSSSERRSHEGGHYGGSYSGRQESYGGAGGERRSFVGEERRRSVGRDSYRKPSGMGPPRESRPMSRGRPPRRSFRGRTMRVRGSFRGAPRSRGTFVSRRYSDRAMPYSRAFKTIRGRSPIKSKEEASSTEEDWDAEDDKEEEETIEEKKETKIKSPKMSSAVSAELSEGGAGAGEASDTEKEEVDAASDAAPPRRKLLLHCVHCKEKSPNIPAYAKHLMGVKHRAAMSAVARRHKAQVLRMRVAQREAQRALEDGELPLAPRTAFCGICRLNHRTTRHHHNLSDTHQAMKRFLLPFCRVCRLSFRSPMIYEHHVCSINHLKRKANQLAKRASPKADHSGDEGMDVDLDNFMTLDSVGDVDEVDDEDEVGETKKEEADPKKTKVDINIGSEHIKKVSMWWCELCRLCLPRTEPDSAAESEALRRHCRTRAHLSRYVQHRDDRTLRRQAARIHRQLHRQRGEANANGAADDTAEKGNAEVKQEPEDKKLENGVDTNASGSEDKIWADVDKEVGDLLREVDPQGNEGSDDDDDLDRYEKYPTNDKSNAEDEEGDVTTDNVAESSTTEINTPA